MSKIGRLATLVATVGATVAAVKVADRVSKNNPEGIPDHNENGTVDVYDYGVEAKKAAGEIYHETSDTIKQKVPEAIETIKQTAYEAKEAATDAYYKMKNSFSQPPDVVDIEPDSVTDVPDTDEAQDNN